MRSFVLLIVAP